MESRAEVEREMCAMQLAPIAVIASGVNSALLKVRIVLTRGEKTARVLAVSAWRGRTRVRRPETMCSRDPTEGGVEFKNKGCRKLIKWTAFRN